MELLAEESKTENFSKFLIKQYASFSKRFGEDAEKLWNTVYKHMPEFVNKLLEDQEIVKYFFTDFELQVILEFRLFECSFFLKPEYEAQFLEGDLSLSEVLAEKANMIREKFEEDKYFYVSVGIKLGSE